MSTRDSRSTGTEAEPRRISVPPLVWLGLVYACHVALLLHFLPLEAVFGKLPIQGVDFDLHIGQVFRVSEALERFGHSWLYDVELLAGQPEGTITDAGSKAWELWTFALHHYLGTSRAVGFNTFVLLVMLASPGLIYAASRTLRLGNAPSVWAAAMASTLWYFDSHVHWLWYIGMVSWALASCLAVLTFALFYRLIEDEKMAFAAPCAVGLGTGLLIHPYTFFSLSVPLATCYLRRFRSVPTRVHLAVIGIVIVAIAMNAYWLHNAFLHWHYILNSAYYAQGRPELLACDVLDLMCSAADSGVIGTRTGFRFIYQGLALGGLWLWRRDHDRRWVPVGVGLTALYAMAYLGKYSLGLSQTQPYRQLTTALWMTLVPAAYFLHVALREIRWQSRSTIGKVCMLTVSLALAKQLLTSQVLYFVPRLLPEPEVLLDGSKPPLSKYGFWTAPNVESHIHYGLPHNRTVELGAQELMGWISDHIPATARILIEGGPIGERLAWRTDHEVLGGFVERNVAHVDANFFRQYAHSVPSRSFMATYLRAYAVEWVIGNHPAFEDTELLEPIATVSSLNVYRMRWPSSRVLTGGGSVRASMNQIRVQGSSSNEELVLSYHFHEALRCRPDCRVERKAITLDRVGLIQVPAPHPADLTIYNSYDFSHDAKRDP